MKEEKMHLINKLFESDSIRTIWDSEEEKYYVSVVDVVKALTKSDRPRKYWSDLKNKILDEGFQLSEKIGQLKLKAEDGKYYNTDVVDIEGMFRIIESIPSKNAEPIKQWLARLGSERIDEVFDPSIALQRSIDLYRSKGYDEIWIAKRVKGIQDRKSLTDVWKESGIESEIEYSILTNEIYKAWSGMTYKEYKKFKGLKKEHLRDNMDNIELILTDLSEEATKMLVVKKQPSGLEENMDIAKLGGSVAKVAKENLEEQLEELVIVKYNRIK
jgi:hypothetical protein